MEIYSSSRKMHTSKSDKEDDFLVVHAATAASCPRSLLRLIVILYPHLVTTKDVQGRLPIHIASSRPIHRPWKLDWKVDEQESSVLDWLLKASPESAEIPDKDDRLPIHLAIELEKKFHSHHYVSNHTTKSTSKRRSRRGRQALLGKSIDGNIATLIRFCPQSLSTRDGKRHGMLSPFMLAGCDETSNFNLCYELLRIAPEAIQNILHHHNDSSSHPNTCPSYA